MEILQAVAPLLADIERILTTKSHLREVVPLSQTLGHLPFDPVFRWDEICLGSVGTLTTMGVVF